MPAFADLPVRRKLTMIIMVTTTIGLLLASGAFVVLDQVAFRRTMVDGLVTVARIIGYNCTAALSFGDAQSAEQTLQGLAAQPHIVAASVYDENGVRFATYQRDPRMHIDWPETVSEGTEFRANSLRISEPIELAGEIIGTIFMQSDLGELRGRLQRYAWIIVVVAAGAALIAWLVATRLQRVISQPVAQLAAIASRVTAEKDYTLRVPPAGRNELGRLIDGFNNMLAQIQARDAELRSAQELLEQRVRDRTVELQRAQEDTARERVRLKFIFDSVPVGISWMVQGRLDTRIVNSAHARITGVPAAHCQEAGRHQAATHPEDRVRQDALRRQLAAGTTDHYALEKRYQGAEGSWTWALLTVRVFRDDRSGEAQEIATVVDITERKRVEADLERAHRDLLQISRAAGMAEVATGVLHNVGNVLNSVNVSATLIADTAHQSDLPQLARVCTLLQTHEHDLAGFFARDPKAGQLPRFLRTLSEQLHHERTRITTESENLRRNIEHIKEIVEMQQNYARVSGVVETVAVVELVEDALRMNAGALARHDVVLARDFRAQPTITVEKHKVLQILVNLLRNAKYACDDSGRLDKSLTVQIDATADGIEIAVIDNGVGIPAENLARIFAHGFTTRKNGHGFGLHSGALAAKEMGGALRAFSDGPGCGARFVLTLPQSPGRQREATA